MCSCRCRRMATLRQKLRARRSSASSGRRRRWVPAAWQYQQWLPPSRRPRHPQKPCQPVLLLQKVSALIDGCCRSVSPFHKTLCTQHTTAQALRVRSPAVQFNRQGWCQILRQPPSSHLQPAQLHSRRAWLPCWLCSRRRRHAGRRPSSRWRQLQNSQSCCSSRYQPRSHLCSHTQQHPQSLLQCRAQGRLKQCHPRRCSRHRLPESPNGAAAGLRRPASVLDLSQISQGLLQRRSHLPVLCRSSARRQQRQARRVLWGRLRRGCPVPPMESRTWAQVPRQQRQRQGCNRQYRRQHCQRRSPHSSLPSCRSLHRRPAGRCSSRPASGAGAQASLQQHSQVSWLPKLAGRPSTTPIRACALQSTPGVSCSHRRLAEATYSANDGIVAMCSPARDAKLGCLAGMCQQRRAAAQELMPLVLLHLRMASTW